MKYKFIFIPLLVIVSFGSYGQNGNVLIQGKVTFVTSKNVYVKFDDTQMIKIGDTLQISNNVPCLLVSNKSSRSIVCTKINNCDIKKDIIVTYTYKIEIEDVEENETIEDDIDINYNDSIKAIEKTSKKTFYTENIKARLSASSYSNFSNIRDNTHRIMSRFSLYANHINNSKYSVETYFNYRQNILSGERSNFKRKNYFRVFNLALIYDVDSTLSVTLGRKINYKISSLGAIDGLQVEKFFGNNYVGIIAGFRPDIFDFGFNSNLLQYGTYIGRLTNSENFYSQTTLGVAEQRNNGEIDRRFTYFQHSSTIFNKLNLFSALELDIFNKVNDTVNNNVNNKPRLTNLYLSARYKINRKVNFSLSYDSRKQIIYYKTFETNIDKILDEDIARQGIRARVNIKPFKKVFSGFSYSKRFQSNNQNKSDNIYGYVSYSKLPNIGGRLSLTYNMNSSNFLDSNIASLRYSRAFMDNRLNADFYYRFVNYKYTSNIPDFSQNYYGAYLSYYLDRSLIISLSGEYSTFDQEHNYRINTRIIKRFYRQRKK